MPVCLISCEENTLNSELNEGNFYEVLGEEGFGLIAAGFYRRVREDDLLGPMYPDDDWEGAEQRLRDFLVFRFGGPPRYIEERGHPRLRMRHFPYRINSAARDRWVRLMSGALEETPMPENVRDALLAFFRDVADFLRNRPDR